MGRKPFLTRKEVCAALEIGVQTFRTLVKSGALRPVAFPGYARKRVVRTAEVDELRRSFEQEAKAA